MDKELLAAAWIKIGADISTMADGLEQVVEQTYQHNNWFTPEEQHFALQHFSQYFLEPAAISDWLAQYPDPVEAPRNVGLILAGNIPYVGMHDIMSTLSSGHKAIVKLSSKDKFFFPWLRRRLEVHAPAMAERLVFADQLKTIDAIIATGSNNTSRYFEYYFGKYPHVFRQNRTSVAIIDGNEDEETVIRLGEDVFRYFGLGCRNVGKLFLPKGYHPDLLLQAWKSFESIGNHNKYKNNLDYNLTLLLLNQEKVWTSEFLVLAETEKLHAPLATLYYSYYDDKTDWETSIASHADELQCIVGNGPNHIAHGQTQLPGLMDYADHLDTMAWLHQL